MHVFGENPEHLPDVRDTFGWAGDTLLAPYTVTPIADKGLGCVATRALPAGQLLGVYGQLYWQWTAPRKSTHSYKVAMWRGDYTHGLHNGSATASSDMRNATPLYACGRWALPAEVGPGSFFNSAGKGEAKNVSMGLRALTFRFGQVTETIPVYVFYTTEAVQQGDEFLWDYTLRGEVFQSHAHVTNRTLFDQSCFSELQGAFGYDDSQ